MNTLVATFYSLVKLVRLYVCTRAARDPITISVLFSCSIKLLKAYAVLLFAVCFTLYFMKLNANKGFRVYTFLHFAAIGGGGHPGPEWSYATILYCLPVATSKRTYSTLLFSLNLGNKCVQYMPFRQFDFSNDSCWLQLQGKTCSTVQQRLKFDIIILKFYVIIPI